MFKHLTVICESEITHMKIISPDAKFMIASIMHYEGQGCTLDRSFIYACGCGFERNWKLTFIFQRYVSLIRMKISNYGLRSTHSPALYPNIIYIRCIL